MHERKGGYSYIKIAVLLQLNKGALSGCGHCPGNDLRCPGCDHKSSWQLKVRSSSVNVMYLTPRNRERDDIADSAVECSTLVYVLGIDDMEGKYIEVSRHILTW